MTRQKRPVSPEAQQEIRRFADEIENLDKGRLDPDDFKRFRLNNGVYGIRMSVNHMIRIKVPYGCLDSDQLEAIAEVAEKYTPTRLSHITTRQAVQIHNIKRPDLPEILRILSETGLTTREACGNTVRNISCDPFAGIAADEVFDPRPYADLVYRYFLRNPVCQNLPRKFKIAFEGCPASDRARIGIHDLGFRAKIKTIDGKPVRGFEVTVGGGLGAMPFAAQLLEEFVPADDIIPTTEAVIRIFDLHGDRRDKNRARIKFVVAKWGIEEFRKVFHSELSIAKLTAPGRREPIKLEWTEETAPQIQGRLLSDAAHAPGYDEWRRTNVMPQRQKGFSAVVIRCYLGDVTPAEARGIASMARDFCGGRLRTAITQNLVMTWVPDAAIATVYARLAKLDLALPYAHEVADITRCPGADTCNLAITHSKGLAHDITQKVFQDGYAKDPLLRDITIKISGCMNSCGQHHIADLGFFGASKNVDGKQVPHYQFLIGGRTGLAYKDIKFGERVAFVPARRIHEVVRHVLDLYKKDRRPSENFSKWIDRKGVAFFQKESEPFQDLESVKHDPRYFEDLGDEGTVFKVAVGKGECAA